MESSGLIDPEAAASLMEIRDGGLFAGRLLDLAHGAAGVEELFAYRVGEGREGEGAPQVLASSSGLGDVAERAEAYARRFHRSDPAVAARLRARPGSGFHCRIPAEAIELGAYRQLCFERPRFAEKIVFGWRWPDHALVVSFYHRHGRAEPDLIRLGALAQLAITGLTRLERPAAPLLAEVTQRLASAHPALTAREREVCARSLTGQTARQIAGELGLGAGTVLTYRQRAYAKTGSNKASDLLAAVMG